MDMREAADRLLAATEARRVELGKKWKQVYQEAGVTHQTLNRWRHGHPVAPLTERALERALLWGPGAREAIARYAQPEDLGEPATTPSSTTPAPQPPALSPNEEALRTVVSAAAKGLQLKPERLDHILRLAREDLDELPPQDADEGPPTSYGNPARTDLSDMVRARRLEAGLSLEAVAARAVDPSSGENVVDADWLDRLERAVLGPAERPEYPQLDALVDALHLDPGQVQEAAGVQFFDVHTVWSDDGQVRALVAGELDAEDLAKVQTLMALYRHAPHRDG
jgi:hypothetical protein